MDASILREITADQLRDDLPEFGPGDSLRIHVRVIEGDKERTQVFEGDVIQRKGDDQKNHIEGKPQYRLAGALEHQRTNRSQHRPEHDRDSALWREAPCGALEDNGSAQYHDQEGV